MESESSIEIIMKVDKSVCTSNDAYFADNTTTTTTTNELSSIIKFETVFTTLVENKILAIKRECEEHESKKKSRTLKGILLRKSNDVVRGATIDEDKSKEAQEEGEVVEGINAAEDKKKRKNFFSKYYKKQKTFPDVEDVERGNSRNDNDELVNVVVVKNDYNNDDREKGVNRRRRRSRSEAKLDSQSNELDIVVRADANLNLLNSSAKLNAAECDKQNCDKLIIDSQENNAQIPLSTNNHSNVSCRKQQAINYENDESLATTIDISLQQQSSAVLAASSKVLATVPINNNISNNIINNSNNNKSDLAICDDGVSSQNTSDIEFSLPSENSMSDLPRSSKVKSVADSDPVIKNPVNVVSPPLSTRNKKACERKAISCQSTPIFLRHKHVRSESEGKKVLTFQKELPKSNNEHSYGKIDTIKSQTIVTAPTSTKTTTTLAKPTTMTSIYAVSGHLPPLEAVHVVSNASAGSKKGQKHSTKLRDVSLEYKITYDDEDENHQSPHGFISSFNQLTSQKQSAAIISANIKKQTSRDQHRKVELVCQKDEDEENAKQDIELDELDVETVGKKKKNKRRSKFSILSRVN